MKLSYKNSNILGEKIMKKIIILSVAIILTGLFTACNSQEQSNEPQVIESTVINTSSQAEQTSIKEYIGKWNYSYNDINGSLSINQDKTFTFSVDDIENINYSTVISVSGTYEEISENSIKLIATNRVHYDSSTKETQEETVSNDDINKFAVCTIEDSNTLIIDDGTNKEEITRINKDI